MTEHIQYDKPEHVLEDRPGHNPNQYIIPFETPQYVIQFPNESELENYSELEQKLNEQA